MAFRGREKLQIGKISTSPFNPMAVGGGKSPGTTPSGGAASSRAEGGKRRQEESGRNVSRKVHDVRRGEESSSAVWRRDRRSEAQTGEKGRRGRPGECFWKTAENEKRGLQNGMDLWCAKRRYAGKKWSESTKWNFNAFPSTRLAIGRNMWCNYGCRHIG